MRRYLLPLLRLPLRLSVRSFKTVGRVKMAPNAAVAAAVDPASSRLATLQARVQARLQHRLQCRLLLPRQRQLLVISSKPGTNAATTASAAVALASAARALRLESR